MSLRVLLDARLQGGGVGRYGRTLVEGLRRVAPEVSPQTFEAERPLERLTRTPLTPWGRVAVRRAVQRLAPELLHGLHLELPPAPGIACVVTVLDLIPLDHPPSMPSRVRRAAYRRLVDASLRRAERIVVPSDATARTLERRGVEAVKLRVVPLAVDPAFRASSEAERLAARERFAGGRAYIAASVTGRAHKNAPLLAAAASRLRPPVISTGSPVPRLDSLRFTGRLGDGELRRFYAGAECVVVPSLIEGFGLTAAEALACGVPVVCGPGLGALPYLRPGALVVDVEDAESLAEGMRRLVEDEVRRTELAEAGHEAAAALTIDSMAARTADVYREAKASFAAL